jgi:hypothetical protein
MRSKATQVGTHESNIKELGAAPLIWTEDQSRGDYDLGEGVTLKGAKS